MEGGEIMGFKLGSRQSTFFVLVPVQTSLDGTFSCEGRFQVRVLTWWQMVST